jgi:uncharacterized integral membrane protein
MQNVWLKIKVWTKITIYSLLVLYIICFTLLNANKPVKIWFWYDQEPETTVVRVILVTLLAGVAGTLLTGTVVRTIRQIRQLKSRSRTEQIERDVAQLKSRAGMLQTKPLPGDQPTIAPPPPQL